MEERFIWELKRQDWNEQGTLQVTHPIYRSWHRVSTNTCLLRLPRGLDVPDCARGQRCAGSAVGTH